MMVEGLARTWRRLGQLNRDQLAGLVALLGLLAYAMLYFAYFQFYVSFGLRPSDVGLTRIRLLEESLIGLVLVPFVTVFNRWHLLVVIIALALLVRLAFSKIGDGAVPGVRELTATAVVVFMASLLIFVASGYVDLVVRSRELGNEARRDGRVVIADVGRRGGLYLPYLDVQAVPVDVAIPDSPLHPRLTRGCTFYLGQSDSQAVIVDVRRETVVRLPLDDLQITLHPAVRNYRDERLPSRCASNEGNEAK